VTEPASPPKGGNRAALGPNAAPARTADKPALAPRGAASAADQSSIMSKSAKAGEVPRTPAPAAGVIRSGQTAPAAQSPRSAAAANIKSLVGGSARPAEGSAAAPIVASIARPGVPVAAPAPRPPQGERPARASAPSSRETARAAAGVGEPYPPLAARMVNGNGAAAGLKNPRHLTPRSPRTALEPDTIEVPMARSKKARHPFVVIGNAIISLFVLVAILAAAALVIGKQRFDAPGPLPEDRVVNIPRGSGIRDIADVLTRDGVIDQPWVFVGGVLALKAREDLKAGEYQFKAHASLRDVVATIVEGRVVAHQLTVPEGLTSEQIVARLLDDDVLAGNIKEIPREGSLLPDTYNFTRGITREQIIQRMQQAQQRTLKEIWERHSPDLPIKTPEQLVVLASLVEKETGKPEERTRVAAVFVNRLKQKMRLQSDPTIIYGLVGGKGTLGRPIMRSEIDQPTPFNTYQIDGLPPGPIANPGRASLEAAANPARTRELYFVADGAGGHAFAETYEQHQKNVARLRAMETDQKDQAPADTQSSAPQSAATPPASGPPQQRRTPTRRNQTAQPAH